MNTAEATAPGVVGGQSSAADPILVADDPTATPAGSAATTPATSAGSDAPRLTATDQKETFYTWGGVPVKVTVVPRASGNPVRRRAYSRRQGKYVRTYNTCSQYCRGWGVSHRKVLGLRWFCTYCFVSFFVQVMCFCSFTTYVVLCSSRSVSAQ